VKHSNFSFFIWGYMPRNRLDEHNSTEFFKRIFRGWIMTNMQKSGVIREYSDSLIQKGYFNVTTSMLPDSPTIEKLGVVLSLIGSTTFGFEGDEGKDCPQFVREGCISLNMITQDDVDASDWKKKINGYLRIYELFAEIFNPIHCLGHRDYNKWWDDSFEIPIPEARIWPYNIFGLQDYNPVLKDRLLSFADNHKDEWTLKILKDRTAILHINDLTTTEDKIRLDVTRAILGEADTVLLPRRCLPYIKESVL